MVLFRGLPSVILLLIWARAGRQSIVPTSWKLHLWRNLSGVTSMWLGFAIAHLPLATATSLNYTAPLFIACWMLGWGGAQRDAVRITAVALGFLGVIAVLRPSINDDQWLAALLGLTAGAMSAVAMMQIRQLGRIGEPEWRTVLFFPWRSVCPAPPAGLRAGPGRLARLCRIGGRGRGRPVRPAGDDAGLRPGLGAADRRPAVLHHHFAALLGMGLWGDRLDGLAWAGMALIIFAGLLSVWRTMRDPKPA